MEINNKINSAVAFFSVDPNVEYINIIVVKRSPEKKATAEFILLLISIFY